MFCFIVLHSAGTYYCSYTILITHFSMNKSNKNFGNSCCFKALPVYFSWKHFFQNVDEKVFPHSDLSICSEEQEEILLEKNFCICCYVFIFSYKGSKMKEKRYSSLDNCKLVLHPFCKIWCVVFHTAFANHFIFHKLPSTCYSTCYRTYY